MDSAERAGYVLYRALVFLDVYYLQGLRTPPSTPELQITTKSVLTIISTMIVTF